MTSDGSSGPGLSRSFTALGGDLAEAATWLVGHGVLFALSLAVWVGVGTLLAPEVAATADLPAWVTGGGLGRTLWFVLLVFAPAVAVGNVLGRPAERSLGRRPATVFVPLVPVAVVTVGLAIVAGESPWIAAQLALATGVLIRRTLHWYVQHVRVGRLGRVGRTLLATLALIPLSAALLLIETALVGRYAAVEMPGTAGVKAWLVARGVPASVDVGAASIPGDVAALLAAAALVPVTYLIAQWVAGYPTTAAGSTPGRAPASDGAAGWPAAVWSGTIVARVRSAVGRARGEAVDLPGDRGEWKYEDPEAERAHRRAQQRDPSDAVEVGEVISLVLEEADYSYDPPTLMGTHDALKVFVDDAPDDLERLDTVCVKVTGYGGKNTSADAVFLSRGNCSDADR